VGRAYLVYPGTSAGSAVVAFVSHTSDAAVLMPLLNQTVITV